MLSQKHSFTALPVQENDVFDELSQTFISEAFDRRVTFLLTNNEEITPTTLITATAPIAMRENISPLLFFIQLDKNYS